LTNAVAIAAGNLHGAALKADGTVTNWGTFRFSDGGYTPVFVPSGLSNVVFLASGYGFDVALLRDGKVRAWGTIVAYGQTNVPPSLTNVAAIATSHEHCLALRADGSLLGWGYNAYGQATLPPELQGNTVAIACGLYHSLAIKADGTVVAWGWNSYGQATVPGGLSNVIAVAGGDYHSLALKADGSVVAWGRNGFETIVPSGLTGAVAIAAYGTHSAATKADGTVVIWGSNAYGERAVPFYVTNAAAIAGGPYHSMVLMGDVPPIPRPLPINLIVPLGTRVSLPAAVAGTKPFSHQWLLNGTNLPGATNLVFELDHVQRSDSGKYSAVVSNALGMAVNSYTLEMSPLIIAVQPQSQSVFGGATVTFGVAATGKSLNYQWQFNGTNLSGATNNSLVFTNVLLDRAGVYSVVVSNLYGAVASSDAVLDVKALGITTQPQDQFVFGGATTAFSVVAAGISPLNYRWRLNGTNLTEAIGSTLVLTNVQPNQSGVYSVVVSNAYAQVISSNAVLGVTTLGLTAIPQNISTFRGATATFGVTAVGNPPLTYQWHFYGNNLPSATNATLTVTNVQYDQEGVYSVTVDNPFTNITCYANLFVGQVANWNFPYSQMANPPSLTNIIALATGGYHNIALRGDGTIVVWGLNTGNGELSIPQSATNVIAIAAGGSGNVVLKADGTVVSWGNNVSGGNAFPPSATNVVAIAAGASQTLALRADGTLIGAGATTIPLIATNVVAMAAGYIHCLVLKDDGTVVSWGGNNYGQATVPASATNIVAVAAGGYDSLALRADGLLIAWGQSYGTVRNFPPDGTNTAMIRAGFGFSLALKTDGLVKETTGSTSMPQGLNNVIAIAAGNSQALALIGDRPPEFQAFLTHMAWNTAGFCVSIASQSGRVYRLEYQNYLNDLSWTALPLVAGNGGAITLIDPTAKSTQRFYRVRQW